MLHAFVLSSSQMLKRFVLFLLVNDKFDPKYSIIAKMLVFFLKMSVEKYNKRKEKGKKHTILPNFWTCTFTKFAGNPVQLSKNTKNIIKSRHWNPSFEWDPFTGQMEDIWSFKLKIFRDLPEATKEAQKDYLIVPSRGIAKIYHPE